MIPNKIPKMKRDYRRRSYSVEAAQFLKPISYILGNMFFKWTIFYHTNEIPINERLEHPNEMQTKELMTALFEWMNE